MYKELVCAGVLALAGCRTAPQGPERVSDAMGPVMDFMLSRPAETYEEGGKVRKANVIDDEGGQMNLWLHELPGGYVLMTDFPDLCTLRSYGGVPCIRCPGVVEMSANGSRIDGKPELYFSESGCMDEGDPDGRLSTVVPITDGKETRSLDVRYERGLKALAARLPPAAGRSSAQSRMNRGDR
jgi:hypothetical protein